jgi:hypothetical protein
MTMTNSPGYAFDNRNAHAPEEHRCLAAGYDELTIRRLRRLRIRPGMRCLEVGAGGGGIAYWLADRVAPGGSVLATDIQTQHLRPRPGLEIRVHDITVDPLARAGVRPGARAAGAAAPAAAAGRA